MAARSSCTRSIFGQATAWRASDAPFVGANGRSTSFPAGVWQAAVPIGEGYSLCGCTVALGFDFADFEMPSRSELVTLFPAERELVERLGRA